MNPPPKNSEQNNKVVVTFLNLLLADEYVLYTKTRTAHWNVDGSNYFETHVFLENQFNTIDMIIDDLADQIRSHGHFALGSLKDFLSIAQMSEDNQDFANSGKIFETLLSDHETIIRTIQHELFPISVNLKDIETADFLAGILKSHKKMAWLLRKFITEPDFKETIHFVKSVNQLIEQAELKK
jgi:starvation-inducible DNA-binding protein